MTIVRALRERNGGAEPIPQQPQLEQEFHDLVRREPPVRGDITPRVTELLSASITQSCAGFTAARVEAARLYYEDAKNYYEGVQRWAEQELERAREYAQDIAEHHAHLLGVKERWEASANPVALPPPEDTPA